MPAPSNQQTSEIPDHLLRLLKFCTEGDRPFIEKNLSLIWIAVRNISGDSSVFPDEIEFEENVERLGKEAFIDELQRIAADGTWKDLLRNSTLLDSFYLTRPAHDFGLDVFLKSVSTVPHTSTHLQSIHGA
jgi:hypothetical protein